MSTTFRPYVPDQSLLLPPDVREWLPEGHLAHHVSDLVDGLDLMSTVAGKRVILDRTATTTCRGRMSGHRQQEPVWTSRARSRRQGRQPRGAGAERSDAP